MKYFSPRGFSASDLNRSLYSSSSILVLAMILAMPQVAKAAPCGSTGIEVLSDGVCAISAGIAPHSTGSEITVTGPNTAAIVMTDGQEIPDPTLPNLQTTSQSLLNVGAQSTGIWLENVHSTQLGGSIDLQGDGAIGLHAKGGRSYALASSAKLQFSQGEGQVGYYFETKGAHIDVAKGLGWDVATNRSKLFELRNGTHLILDQFTIGVSGADSIGIHSSGEWTPVHIVAGDFSIGGAGSTALLIEGGASALLEVNTNIALDGSNTFAGIVDGQQYDASGAPIGSPNDYTILKMHGRTTSAQENATGYLLRNSSNLLLTGDVTLSGANSTGVEIGTNGRAEISDNEVVVTGDAFRADQGASTFDLNNVTASGSDSLLNALQGAATEFTAVGSTLEGAIRTDALGRSNVTLQDQTQWLITDNSALTNLSQLNSDIAFAAPIGISTLSSQSRAGGFKGLDITENYVGSNGLITLNAQLGDNSSPSDFIHIHGDSSGEADLKVVNVGGAGALTSGDGIKIIAVDGQSNATFALRGDYLQNGKPVVIAGAYGYSLWKNGVADPTDGDWYLRSHAPAQNDPDVPNGTPVAIAAPLSPSAAALNYQPGAPVYEAYPNILAAMIRLPTLQQRVGQRFWDDASGTQTEGRGAWLRFEGSKFENTPKSATSLDSFKLDTRGIRAGIEEVIAETDNGRWIGGINLHYLDGAATTFSQFGTGHIDTKQYGIGVSATYYAENGFYLDAQAQFSQFRSDLNSDVIGTLAESNKGKGYVLSLEAGQRIKLNEAWAITPQAQVMYSKSRFDGFIDSYGAAVSGDTVSGTSLRLGVAADRQITTGANRSSIYGIANIIYNDAASTRVAVSGTDLNATYAKASAELGLGGTYNWNNDMTSVYGQVSATRGLGNAKGSRDMKVSVGMRIKF